jgi:mono/diheme cytochrome c family protein
MLKKILLIAVVIAALILTACGEGNSAEAEPGSEATLEPVPAEFAGQSNPLGADSAAEGQTIFETYCATCHGPEGHGDGPAGQSLDPRPKDLAELQAQVGDDYLFWRISDGKAGTAMVAWKDILTEEQIWQVASFIRTLK